MINLILNPNPNTMKLCVLKLNQNNPKPNQSKSNKFNNLYPKIKNSKNQNNNNQTKNTNQSNQSNIKISSNQMYKAHKKFKDSARTMLST